MNIWDVANTGSYTRVDVKGNIKIDKSDCALCGQCITHCPVNALKERDDTGKVRAALADPDAFKDVRGIKGWKEATFEIAGVPLHVAVANGLSNARDLLEALKKGEVKYDFVEVMACPGGCVGGGGQPIHDRTEMAKERGQILYDLDRNNPIRFSHENPSIIKCYENYLQRPLSHRAHQLLHTDHNGWSLQDLKYGAELRTDEKSSLTDKH